jgi:hypothetical protein
MTLSMSLTLSSAWIIPSTSQSSSILAISLYLYQHHSHM